MTGNRNRFWPSEGMWRVLAGSRHRAGVELQKAQESWEQGPWVVSPGPLEPRPNGFQFQCLWVLEGEVLAGPGPSHVPPWTRARHPDWKHL